MMPRLGLGWVEHGRSDEERLHKFCVASAWLGSRQRRRMLFPKTPIDHESECVEEEKMIIGREANERAEANGQTLRQKASGSTQETRAVDSRHRLQAPNACLSCSSLVTLADSLR